MQRLSKQRSSNFKGVEKCRTGSVLFQLLGDHPGDGYGVDDDGDDDDDHSHQFHDSVHSLIYTLQS